MSSTRSNSHASIDGHDEPLLPLGAAPSAGLDASWMSLGRRRARPLLTKAIYKRVLAGAVALLFLLAVVVYRNKPVSFSGAIINHHHPHPHKDHAGPHTTQGQGQGQGQVQTQDQQTQDKGQAAAAAAPQGQDQDQPSRTQQEAAAPAAETRQAIVVVLPSAGVDIDRQDEDQDGPGDAASGDGGHGEDGVDQELEAKKQQFQDEIQKKPWLRYTHLNGYFHGLKTLVPPEERISEYPNPNVSIPAQDPPIQSPIPRPEPFNPYGDEAETGAAACFLDANQTIPAPDIYAFNGLPPHYPDPVLGSYEALGMRDDVCFDRFARYGPYGLGYPKSRGGLDIGEDTESAGAGVVWEKTGQIDYSDMDWGAAQTRCLEANEHRLRSLDASTGELQKVEGDSPKKGRTAVVLRAYTDFKWTEHAILNLRAMVNELSLRSGGEYTVHLLVQVRDGDVPFWSDPVTVQRLLDANVPPEFHGLVSLWSEPQMRLYYPGKFDAAYSNPSGRDLHGVYRGAHLPLQIFAMEHPQYEHYWNWEMDMRSVGSYYELMEGLGGFGAAQPREMLWERSARYYIPSYHGTWDNFTEETERETVRSGLPSPFGPLMFSGRKSLRFEAQGESVLPADCDAQGDRSRCGVGEAADLITLNPIFDTEQSGWYFGMDATGYGPQAPPRRASIVTASRLSRRLLMAMHEEVWRHHRTMFPEMFPASVALHHGFKAVFAPHPIYMDRAWLPFGKAADAAFNGGEHHSTSGHGSPFDLGNEHNHKGTSWYYNSDFAGLVWRRWLGYAQMDGRGKFGGQGKLRGGKGEEEKEESLGRLCLRSMLLHPIKKEHPDD